MEEKQCIGCGCPIERQPHDNQWRWDRRLYCNKSCAQTKHDIDDKKIVSLWNMGLRLWEIANLYNIAGHTVKARLLANGIEINPGHAERARRALVRNSTIDKESGCWCWHGYINRGGYGVIGFQGKQQIASRVSYLVFRGDFDRSKDVCHTCDNRGCVNPKHLFIGSRQDNVDDAVHKNRHAKGDRLPQTKLTESNVRSIIAMHYDGKKQKDIAALYGVALSTVNAIVKRRNWKHVSLP